MPELVGNGERAQRPDGVRKERVWAVEGVDVPFPRGQLGPAMSLHRSGGFQRHLVEGELPRIARYAALQHEAAEVSVGADVVEAVIVDAKMGDVRRHPLQRVPPARLEELRLAGGVELEDLRAILKALRPFRPAPGGIPSFHREYGGPECGVEVG